MRSDCLELKRRTFTALLVHVVPAFGWAAAERAGSRFTFLNDLRRSYEQQLIGVDMEDVNAVVGAIETPVLGYGLATAGRHRAEKAAIAALADLNKLGRHSLVVIASAPGSMNLREYRSAFNVVRAASVPDAVVIYAPCRDRSLTSGTVRVSVLTG